MAEWAVRDDLAAGWHGRPLRLSIDGTGEVLRWLGIRAVVHPRDVAAFSYVDAAAAVAWSCAYRARWGYRVLGIVTGPNGRAAGVLDLRPAMDADRKPRTSPALPDDYAPYQPYQAGEKEVSLWTLTLALAP